MSDGPRIPQFNTKPGYVYVGEIDVGLMAAIDAQAERERQAAERKIVLVEGKIEGGHERATG